MTNLRKFIEWLKKFSQVRKYWEADIKNQPIGILKAIK